jgi:hypothetical protein
VSPESRFTRQEDLFGTDGQRSLAASTVGIVGLGGLGSFVAIELAYAGVESFVLVDEDIVGVSNLNRLLGAVSADAERAAEKTAVAARAIALVAPGAKVTPVARAFEHPDAQAALSDVDVLFACVDEDPVRLAILAFCCERAIPFFDLASDTGGDPEGGGWYGGRVLFSGEGERCPFCMDLLDQRALARASMSETQRSEDARIYGVAAERLNTGPSVVSINGVVASLAVSEFIKWRTGLAQASGLVTYRAEMGVVMRAAEDRPQGCFYCASWGSRAPGSPQYPETGRRNDARREQRERRRGGLWGRQTVRLHAWKG